MHIESCPHAVPAAMLVVLLLHLYVHTLADLSSVNWVKASARRGTQASSYTTQADPELEGGWPRIWGWRGGPAQGQGLRERVSPGLWVGGGSVG